MWPISLALSSVGAGTSLRASVNLSCAISMKSRSFAAAPSPAPSFVSGMAEAPDGRQQASTKIKSTHVGWTQFLVRISLGSRATTCRGLPMAASRCRSASMCDGHLGEVVCIRGFLSPQVAAATRRRLDLLAADRLASAARAFAALHPQRLSSRGLRTRGVPRLRAYPHSEAADSYNQTSVLRLEPSYEGKSRKSHEHTPLRVSRPYFPPLITRQCCVHCFTSSPAPQRPLRDCSRRQPSRRLGLRVGAPPVEDFIFNRNRFFPPHVPRLPSWFSYTHPPPRFFSFQGTAASLCSRCVTRPRADTTASTSTHSGLGAMRVII